MENRVSLKEDGDIYPACSTEEQHSFSDLTSCDTKQYNTKNEFSSPPKKQAPVVEDINSIFSPRPPHNLSGNKMNKSSSEKFMNHLGPCRSLDTGDTVAEIMQDAAILRSKSFGFNLDAAGKFLKTSQHSVSRALKGNSCPPLRMGELPNSSSPLLMNCDGEVEASPTPRRQNTMESLLLQSGGSLVPALNLSTSLAAGGESLKSPRSQCLAPDNSSGTSLQIDTITSPRLSSLKSPSTHNYLLRPLSSRTVGISPSRHCSYSGSLHAAIDFRDTLLMQLSITTTAGGGQPQDPREQVLSPRSPLSPRVLPALNTRKLDMNSLKCFSEDGIASPHYYQNKVRQVSWSVDTNVKKSDSDGDNEESDTGSPVISPPQSPRHESISNGCGGSGNSSGSKFSFTRGLPPRSTNSIV